MSEMGNKLELVDNSRIAVIGGGPAGSFFSIFTLDLAERMGMDIQLDIYEGKQFAKVGPSGCNHCGGIVSESLVQALSAEGIVLPSDVVRRGIESYTMHLEHGSVLINTPLEEQRIASMFRGAGPLHSSGKSRKSFDLHLMELSLKRGAKVKHEKIMAAEFADDGIVLKSNYSEEKYDLVVGASGLNPRTLRIFESVIPDFVPPETTKTYICEYDLGKEVIDRYFGDSMHVFLLNLAHIKFGALIPKGDYVTLVLLGEKIDKEIVKSFVESKAVKSCFPPGMDLESINPCQCFPLINVGHARNPYNDRIVLIGDTASSKLYKNGIGAAYITARAAANTVIFDGISKADFAKSYLPVCRKLDKDNFIGKLIFMVTGLVQKSSFLKKGLFRMVLKEQGKKHENRKMSSVLWDTFTGSAPYTGILKRSFDPKVILSLLWNLIVALIKPIKK